MKLTKLTKQFSGHQYFKYCVNYTYKDYQQYIDQREWCWTTWGPSVELEFYRRNRNPNPHWAWIVDNHRVRLYLGSDQDASYFALRWGGQ